ncbi:MAG: restriction endonuclease [Elainellaceae cyanobacterium]
MDVAEAKALLEAADDEEPVFLKPSVLDKILLDDIPDQVMVEVGTFKDGVMHLDWSGRLYKDQDQIKGEADYTWTRKYWYSPIGLEHYLDLVRRAVELRNRVHGDVEIIHYDDDGAYIQMAFAITTKQKNLGKAYRYIKALCSELEETAEKAADELGRRISEVASRVSGWGSQNLDELVNAVEKASSVDERGRSLEELISRLFETMPGFTVTDRIKTATEEIDIAVLNDSSDPRFKRESAILLVECKNWTNKCGKNEFVLFKEKIENRSNRCSLGFLVSWNGFKDTVTKEMLRGSREHTLVVPITGKDVRAAVRDANFSEMLTLRWQKAINT